MSAESNQIAPNAPTSTGEVAQNAESRQEAAPAQTEQTEQRSKKRDENFRRMEQKLRETEARVQQMEAERSQATQKTESPDDSDLVTAGQMKRLIAEEARRIANEAVQKSNLETLGDRLQAKHADFNDVVSEDAIEELKEQHPEIFQTLRSNPDPYSKALAAYKFLKMTKGSDSSKSNAKINEKKLEENKGKPNVGASNASVLSQATGWQKPSQDMKRAAYAEMKQAAAKRG